MNLQNIANNTNNATNTFQQQQQASSSLQQLRRHLRKLSKVCIQVAEILHQSLQNQPPLMNKQQKITSAIFEHLVASAKSINPTLPS